MTTPVPATPPRRDLTRTVLAVLLIGILIGASFWVLRPFLLAIVWAAMIVVATWPMMLSVQAALRRRSLAVVTMVGTMLLVFVLPLVLAIQAVVGNLDAITAAIRRLATLRIPTPPDWLSRVPLIGEKIAVQWANLASAGRDEIAAHVAPYAVDAGKWLASAFGSAGMLTLQFLLTVIVAGVMYANGEAVRDTAIRFGRRLAGARGEEVVLLAGGAIRGVALGVVVTALAQTVLAGLGLAVAGVPFAGLLTGVILLLCIAQIGPIIVLAPAVVWLYWSGATAWGTALLVWTVIVGTMDNFLRPILIRRGADLPLLLIFAGVIGGLLAFGIVGLFVGPVVLAVTQTLLNEWINDQDSGEQPARLFTSGEQR